MRDKPGKQTDMLACPDICRATDIEPTGEMPAKADRIGRLFPYPIAKVPVSAGKKLRKAEGIPFMKRTASKKEAKVPDSEPETAENIS